MWTKRKRGLNKCKFLSKLSSNSKIWAWISRRFKNFFETQIRTFEKRQYYWNIIDMLNRKSLPWKFRLKDINWCRRGRKANSCLAIKNFETKFFPFLLLRYKNTLVWHEQVISKQKCIIKKQNFSHTWWNNGPNIK